MNNMKEMNEQVDYVINAGDEAVLLEVNTLKSDLDELEAKKKKIVESYLMEMMDRLKSKTDEIIDSLVSIRKEKGMTQQEVADLVGVKASNIARFEAKKSNPSLQFLSKYAGAVGYEVEIGLVEKSDGGI